MSEISPSCKECRASTLSLKVTSRSGFRLCLLSGKLVHFKSVCSLSDEKRRKAGLDREIPRVYTAPEVLALLKLDDPPKMIIWDDVQFSLESKDLRARSDEELFRFAWSFRPTKYSDPESPFYVSRRRRGVSTFVAVLALLVLTGILGLVIWALFSGVLESLLSSAFPGGG